MDEVIWIELLSRHRDELKPATAGLRACFGASLRLSFGWQGCCESG